MSSTKLRWGILGAARINQQLMPAIVAASNSELIAIASRRPNAAEETLQKYAPQVNNVRLYNSPEKLLNDSNIQAVYIPLATEEHAEWTLRAIAAGKHVLCEKPMALHAADIEAIEAASKEKNVKVMEGFMYRFHPQFQRIQAIIQSGFIGEVRSVRSNFAYPMQPARLYRIERPIHQGGGAMWDIGCYAIHAARSAFGNVKAQSVSALAHYNEHGADISSSGVIDFGEGKYAQFNFSFQHARRAEFEIIGTTGSLKCENVWAKQGDEVRISYDSDKQGEKSEILAAANHFQLEVEHFSDCVLNDTSPALSLTDAKENCLVINAALDSAKMKKWIDLV